MRRPRLSFRSAAVVLVWALAAASASLAAHAAERFRLLAAEGAETLERRLGEAAGEGYGLVATTQGIAAGGEERVVVLMERRERETPLAYRVLATSGDLASDGTAERLRQLGAQGFRLSTESIVARRVDDWYLPETAYADQMFLILEAAREDPGPFEHTVLAVARTADHERELAALGREGHEVLGVWYSGRRLRTVLRRAATPAPVAATLPDDHYRLVIPATRGGLKGRLKEAAAQGYRVVALTDQTIAAPPIVLMARLGRPDEQATYKFLRKPFDKLRKGNLSAKLSKKARKKGYHVHPAGVTFEALLLERVRFDTAEKEPAPTYVAISSKRTEDLLRTLELQMNGARVIAMFHEAEETTILLERWVGRGR